MVTIRLSDSTIMPLEDCAIEDSPTDSHPGEEIGDGSSEPREESTNTYHSRTDPEVINGETQILEEEVKLFQRSHRMSTISMPSIAEEGDTVEASRSFRSRSNSSGTLSSNGSTHVDWDELDKSEESAPRGEGSDEVFQPLPRARPTQANNHSQQHSY